MDTQGYVAPELIHFAGRSCDSDEARFEVLCTILDDARLTADPSAPRDLRWRAQYDWDATLSSNDLVVHDIVCFCDIPDAHLGLHITKYGPFGVAFPKAFLVRMGANPVLYIARESATRRSLLNDPAAATRGGYFDAMFDAYQGFLRDHYHNADLDGNELDRAARLRNLLEYHLLGFVKFFDSARATDDPDNYYMEREWRIIGQLHFSIPELSRVILPERFRLRLLEQFPGLSEEKVRSTESLAGS